MQIKLYNFKSEPFHHFLATIYFYYYQENVTISFNTNNEEIFLTFPTNSPSLIPFQTTFKDFCDYQII